MNPIIVKRIAVIIAAAIGGTGSLPIFAQAPNLEEIVVTARKRDESIKDVPVTVDVFTQAAIESAGIRKPQDFISMVPNMTLVETQNAGNAFVVVRGVSQARNSEPSVAVLVDGVLETNPAEFNQELFDIKQIEVLKGPQGALYGRSAIGGAIIITTQDPSDHLEGRVKAGFGNGSSKRAQAGLSGPIGNSNTLSFRLSYNYYDTEGFIPNAYLGGKADPARDHSARLRLLWKPSDAFTGDLRLSVDRLRTQALYFNIPRSDESNPFTTFSTPPDANNVSTPITVNNRGQNDRDLDTASLKMDFAVPGGGTITSISAYDKTKEILTGDAYDFRPIDQSIFKALLGVDLNQSQFLNVKAYSQELRYTSPTSGKFRWIAGAYFVHTDRFISTGNMVDTGNGVFPVYDTPSTNPLNPQATFLADTQKNDAWAVFADATFDITDQFQADAAIRYDQDRRKNTTDTPHPFIDQLLDPNAVPGEVRSHTWSKAQPKFTLRYKPTDEITVYGGWSRGFRSGGFNQTGVGAVAHANGISGVNDLFDAEVADTTEIGVKGQFLDRRLNAGLSVFHTKSTNGYFFVFLAANSTQNLGNVDATYNGAELELNARVTDRFNVYTNFGYTRSKITGMEDPSVIGNEAPLVSRTTLNAGAQYHQPIMAGLEGTIRLDWRKIGRTWWEPYNVTSRDPLSLLEARGGLEGEKWSAMIWGKNLTDKKYNAEFSPGGFLWKALPRQYGVDVSYKF
jgi:iron complex outermembrane receptor protein